MLKYACSSTWDLFKFWYDMLHKLKHVAHDYRNHFQFKSVSNQRKIIHICRFCFNTYYCCQYCSKLLIAKKILSKLLLFMYLCVRFMTKMPLFLTWWCLVSNVLKATIKVLSICYGWKCFADYNLCLLLFF